ncbi:MAG TPA: AAA family ATPase [Gaiellaceae bacterium]|nr:AAA family ATPase [Gaiellaceae bacterium]
MSRGLVFGKFMPLHRGHQLLIERALAAADDVTVVVYDSAPSGQYDPMPVELRARWIADLHPEVEAVVPLDDPLRENDDSDDPVHAETYARDLEFLGRFDRVFTSEARYQRFASLIGAEHVVVDEARELVPISGTTIREALYEHRSWLDPRVYASLVRKMALVGTESTGKTTLARLLAERHETLWAHEYGRELWIEQGGGVTFGDYLKIARAQHQREERMRRDARRFLFCDTTPWTTLHWCLRSHGTADPRLGNIVDRTMGEYAWFVCDDDFPWAQDGWRVMGDGEARRFQQLQLDDLEARGVPYEVLSGTIEERLETVAAKLQQRSTEQVK